jgi:DNA-binding winged helix-turn-helix (wHTH) protein
MTVQYSFGLFTLDVGSETILKRQKLLRVQRQVVRFLSLLVENRETIVSRTAIENAFWPAHTMPGRNLDVLVWKTRKALGDDSRRQRYIQTCRHEGFRFIAGRQGRSIHNPR